MHDGVILALDGGATRTRCLVVDRAARVLGEGEGGPANHLLVDAAFVRRSLSDAIAGALDAAQVSWTDVRGVGAGLAGVDYDGTGDDDARALFPDVGGAPLTIAGDMVIAHVAALDGGPGVIALAGTGSAIFGIGTDGARVKVGGWGPLYGNEGSAYEIGRRALIAAARAYDGTGPGTALLDALRLRLGVTDFRQSIARVYGHREALGPHEIAALASMVTDAAEAGDEAADVILTQAGVDLAAGVAVVLGRLRCDHDRCAVSYQGSVLERCTRARAAFMQSLAGRAPHVRVHGPRHPPVMGAYWLGRQAAGWAAEDQARMWHSQTPRTDGPAGESVGKEHA